MESITFLHPDFFWLFGLMPFAILWYILKRKHQKAALKVSTLQGIAKKSWLVYAFPFLAVFRLLALSLIIVALARPRTVDISKKSKITRGIDIVMAIDVSGSMLARDFKPNRLEALKRVASEFVEGRPNDRIGIVVYAAESYTKTPVTSDKNMVLNALESVKYDNMAVQDGTGIGVGLATSINRLKDSKAKSKVIILLTDGVNNAGFIEPETASTIAAEYGIKVYTIGIGTNGMAEFPYAYAPNGGFLFKKMPVEIDEELMRSIAKNTEGKYFRATDNRKLAQIYEEINQLETTEIEEQKFYNYEEKFRPLVLLAGLLLLMEIIFRQTLFRGFI
ncbi:MAG: vWA domain-containing protein [Flavobacterium sp.]